MSTIVELKSIPFEDILGNPISAIIEGESRAARATADFIREVGFEPPNADDFEADFGQMRKVFFTMQRTNTEGEKVDVTIEVPLLSLIPIPAIQVKEAVIDFSVKVHEIERIKGQTISSAQPNVINRPTKLARSKHQMYATLMKRRPTATKDTDRETTTDMNVKVTLQQADFPIGVMRLFDLLEQGITERTPSETT